MHFAGMARCGSLKVMVAEEDATLRRIVRVNLEREGFESVGSSSLDECESRLREEDVGLVIISSQLTGFDAQQFSRWLRLEFPRKAMPVVILSFEPEDRLLLTAVPTVLRTAACTTACSCREVVRRGNGALASSPDRRFHIYPD